MQKKIALISVVYENYSILDDLFTSLDKQSNINFHLYLADLSTTKKSIPAKPYLTVINAENKGYAYAVNHGLKEAQRANCKHFVIINSDIILDERFVEMCFSAFAAHPASLITGKIYYAKGYEYHKNRYTKNELGKVLWYAGGSFDWKNALTPHRGVDEMDKGQYNTVEQTEFVTGCLIGFDEQALNKIGYWQEDYFLYYEDADYSVRAQRAKVPAFYDPHIVIWHKNGQSTEGPGSKYQQHLQKKNQLKFGLRFAPLRTKLHLLLNYLTA